MFVFWVVVKEGCVRDQHFALDVSVNHGLLLKSSKTNDFKGGKVCVIKWKVVKLFGLPVIWFILLEYAVLGRKEFFAFSVY